MPSWLARLTYALVVLALALPSVSYGRLDSVVTWSDFSYVRYVASSINYAYFVTTEGVIRYDKMAGAWDVPLTGGEGIDHQDIHKVWVDEFDERLFAETSLELLEYDWMLNRWYPASDMPDLDNRAAHTKAPDVLFAPAGFTISNDGRLADGVGRWYLFTDVLDDKMGDLWLGSWGHGCARAGSSSGVVELLPFGLAQTHVTATLADDERLWIGGAVTGAPRSGISAFDPEGQEAWHIESGLDPDFPMADINCFARHRDKLFIGTTAGVVVVDPGAYRVERRYTSSSGLIDDNALCLAGYGEDLWVGTEDGLSLIALESDSVAWVRPRLFMGLAVYDLLAADGYLWIATSAGVYRRDLTSGKFQRFEDPELFLTGHVYDIARFEDDLWFATREGVLRVETETGDMEPFRGIVFDREIYSVAVNDRVAAVGSSRGLTLIYYLSRKRYTEDYDVNDGLPSDYIYDLRLQGDTLWIGSARGLTRVVIDYAE